MKNFLILCQRIFYAAILLLAVIVLNFLMMHLAPGDIADSIAQTMGGADEEIMNDFNYFIKSSCLPVLTKEQQNKIKEALPFLKIRSKNFNELYQQSEFILIRDNIKISEENKKYLNNKNLLTINNLANKLKNIKWSKENIIETIKTFSFEKKIDFKDVAKLIRIAIVGTTNSPGIYDMMLVLGKLEVVRRFTILER